MDRETNQGQSRKLTPEERELRVKQLKRKRNFRIAIVVAGFAFLLSLIIIPIIVLAGFRVNRFDVEGTAPYTVAEVVAASGIIEGKSLFLSDIKAAKTNIEKVLPYSDDVEITRKLPGTIVIRVGSTEKAYAMPLSNGTYAMLDDEMKVLEYAPEVPEDIMLIKGAVPARSLVGETLAFVNEESSDEESASGDRTLSLLCEITKGISDNSITDIDLIDISSRSGIYLIYQGRIVLNLGDSAEIPAKLSLGQRVINEENAISLTQSGTINLTVPKKAYFNPSDPDDVKELVIFNGGEWEEEESVNQTDEEEATEENDG